MSLNATSLPTAAADVHVAPAATGASQDGTLPMRRKPVLEARFALDAPMVAAAQRLRDMAHGGERERIGHLDHGIDAVGDEAAFHLRAADAFDAEGGLTTDASRAA